MRTGNHRRSPFCLLCLLLLASACGLLPKGTGDRATLTVTPEADGKPHFLSAATVVVTEEAFSSAIEQSGAGLRTGGERKGIRVRYCVLDSASEEFLLESFGATGSSFSPRLGVAAGDEGQIRSGGREEDRGRYTVHLLPEGSGDRLDRIEVGIVARPADGALLPVLRAGIPITGSGTYLVTCEPGSGEVFGAFLRLEVAGTDRAAGTESTRGHRLSMRSYTLTTVELSRVLELEGIAERGGPGGLALDPLPRDRADSLAKALARESTPGPESSRMLGRSPHVDVTVASLSLTLDSTFSSFATRYATVITVRNRTGVPPLEITHDDRQTLLLLGWDAESPGTSSVALFELEPID